MEDVLIVTRDCNGKRTNHCLHWDSVCEYVDETFTEEDEILLVIVEGTCIYSALSNEEIVVDDLTGFFA